MQHAGVASCAGVKTALPLHLRGGRFEQVLVVHDHHVLVDRVIHHELLRADWERRLLEEHVVRLAVGLVVIPLDANCRRIVIVMDRR